MLYANVMNSARAGRVVELAAEVWLSMGEGDPVFPGMVPLVGATG
jgi:hypothetical protein